LQDHDTDLAEQSTTCTRRSVRQNRVFSAFRNRVDPLLNTRREKWRSAHSPCRARFWAVTIATPPFSGEDSRFLRARDDVISKNGGYQLAR
jgi:hypothetical protein